jgi:hypothetical protein
VIWHPLLMAVLALDLLAVAFAVFSGITSMRVLSGWDPQSTDLRQVSLEGATDGASLAGRYALTFFVAATVVLVVGISLVLPALVAGAMCGTGVLTAMKGMGGRTLALRAVALALLWVWRTMDGINRSSPRPPATELVARWQLLSLPLLVLAVVTTWRAAIQLDPYQPVSCCQTVYDNFRSAVEATTTLGFSEGTWLLLTGVGGAGLLVLVVFGLRASAARPGLLRPGWLLLLALSWLPVATTTLIRVLTAYFYEVLHHLCPWCLFLPEHGLVGYPLFAALFGVGVEALAVYTANHLAVVEPTLAAAALARRRRALWMMLLALCTFAILSAFPAFAWRLRHGMWLHGL